MDKKQQKHISRPKAVLASVEWWELYVLDDNGKYSIREDGVSDGTQFWTFDAVETYVTRVLDFAGYDMDYEHCPVDPNVRWIHAVARTDKDKTIHCSRKAVRIRRYLDADELQLLLEGSLGESSEAVRDTLEIENADLAPRKRKTARSE